MDPSSTEKKKDGDAENPLLMDQEDTDTDTSGKHKPPSNLYLLALNSFTFAYGLMVATMGLIVLPEEAVLLFFNHHAIMLGVMLGATGITQLVAPITGYWSDRYISRWGKRRPIMVMGGCLAMVGIVIMWLSHRYLWGIFYIFGLACGITGVNMSYATYTALLPDFVPQEHMGRASGIMAMMTMAGSCLGFACFGFLLDYYYAYPFYAVAITVSIVITCLTAKEVPVSKAPPLVKAEMLAAYYIDSKASPDFFWIFVARTFYYMGVSCQAFILFMLRDVTHVDDPKYWTAMLAMIGQLTAAVVAIPAGKLSDRTGRKPLVYLACCSMTIVYTCFMFAPPVMTVMALGALYGMGNGMFLSVDYALACDTLPSKEHAAQHLGVWGISAFIGSTVGPLIMGPELAYFGNMGNPEAYSLRGYIAVMISGAGFVCVSASLLKLVKNAK